MKTRLTSAALRDLAAGWRFYEGKSPGLGDYFVESISADVARLKSFPGVHVRVGGYHRMLAKRFPFAIYYSVTNDAIVVKQFSTAAEIPLGLKIDWQANNAVLRGAASHRFHIWAVEGHVHRVPHPRRLTRPLFTVRQKNTA